MMYSYPLRRAVGVCAVLFLALLSVAAFRITAQHDTNIPGTGSHPTVVSGPIVVSLGPDITICEGTWARVNARPAAPGTYTYSWTPTTGVSDPTAPDPDLFSLTTTEFVVEVRDAEGNIGRDTIIIIVEPAPKAQAGPDAEICGGGRVRIGGWGSQGGVRYSWSPTTGLDDPTSPNPWASPAVTTMYTLTVTRMNGCTATDYVSVDVVTPEFTLHPPSIDFGELDGCTGWRDAKLKLKNTGTTDILVEQLSGFGHPFAIIDPPPRFVVRRGDEVDVTVRYAPSSVGTHASSVVVVAGPVDAGCLVERQLDLKGRILQAHVATEMNLIEFTKGTDCRWTRRDTIFQVSNNGTSDITITHGIVGAPYTILFPTFPITIRPGENVKIVIRCEIPSPGAYITDVLLPYTSGECADTARVTLSSIIDVRIVTASRSVIHFDTLKGCAAATGQELHLTNTHSLPVTIFKGEMPPGFHIREGLPVTVQPGEIASVVVLFEPTTDGTTSGTMRLVVEPCGTPLLITLTGTSVRTSYELPSAIDFGDIADCAGPPDPITSPLLLRDNGEGEGSVARVTVIGPFSTTLRDGTVLTPGVPLPFDVSFNSTAIGQAYGSIMIRLDPCGVEKTVMLRGSRSRTVVTAAGADFGPTAKGTASTRRVTVTNNGTPTIRVERIEGVAPPFAVVQPLPRLPAELKQGETLTVTVQFTAGSGVAENTIRAVITSPCDTVIAATVRGTGIGGEFAKVAVPSLRAGPGERFRLPVLLVESGGLEAGKNFVFNGVIAFDGSVMAVNGSFASPGDPAVRHVRVSGAVRPGNDTLAVIDAVATLGRTDRTDLKLVEATWTGSPAGVATTTSDGELLLEGICRNGNDRLVAIGPEPALRPARPDPSSGTVEIDYTLIESGAVQLSLYDMYGRPAAYLVDGEAAPGTYTARADLGTLAPGVYICVLRTPTQTFHGRLTVAR